MRIIINKELKVINIGVKEFYHSLLDQGVEAIQVDWRPPAKRDPDLDKLLGKIL